MILNQGIGAEGGKEILITDDVETSAADELSDLAVRGGIELEFVKL